MKLRHYAQPVSTNIHTKFETLILELIIGVICGVYAYMGYGVQVGQLFFPCLIVSIICFSLAFYTIYQIISDKLYRRKLINTEKESDVDRET